LRDLDTSLTDPSTEDSRGIYLLDSASISTS